MYISVITCEALPGKEAEFTTLMEKVETAVETIAGVSSVESFVTDGGQIVSIVAVQDRDKYNAVFESVNGAFHTLTDELKLRTVGRMVSTVKGDTISSIKSDHAAV